MKCDPLVPDDCFIRRADGIENTKVTRHYQCAPVDEVSDPVCKPLAMRTKTGRVFDLCSDFSQDLSVDEKGELLQISMWLSVMDTAIQNIWLEHTQERSLDDERRVPLASMAIIIINQCAVNLTERIQNIPSTFPMRALFISSCIGWTIFWKNTLQGPVMDKRYQVYISAPWETILDLFRTFKSILKLVALVRYRHRNSDNDMFEQNHEWATSSQEEIIESDTSRETEVQRSMNILVSILTSGRVSENSEQIARNYIIPRYNKMNGNLYMYFRNRDRELMCQSSTALISSLLSCILPTEVFGTHTVPGHIYVAWIHDDLYTPIESTVFTAENYEVVGTTSTYTLPPAIPVSNVPYIYTDSIIENDVFYSIESLENVDVLKGYVTFGPLFPFSGKSIVCKSIPLKQIRLPTDNTLLFEFVRNVTPAVLYAFVKYYIVANLLRKLSIVPMNYEENKGTKAYSYKIKDTTIEITASTIVIFDIVEAMESVTSKLNQPIVLRSGIHREPLIQDTKGVAASIMRNVVVYFTKTPSSGTIIVKMKSYMSLKNKGRSWGRVKELIATFKQTPNTYKTDRNGEFEFILGVDAKNASELTDELDTILMRETDGESRAVFHSHDPFGEILDDRVDIHYLRPHNRVNEKHSISQIVAYQWYHGISVMGLSDILIRANIDRFEQTANKCETCIQKTIINMRSVLHEQFPYLDTLSINRRGREKRKDS